MKQIFFKSFLVHDFSSKFDKTGLPNFYREAAIFSQKELQSKISTIEDITLPKYIQSIFNILKKFINKEFLYSLISYKKYNSFIFLTFGGLSTVTLLRLLGLKKKCFLILYEVPFIKYYNFKKNKINFKFEIYYFKYLLFKILLKYEINFIFLSKKQLKIFRSIYKRDVNSDFSFIYGVDLSFYNRYINFKQVKNNLDGFDLNSKYLLFVGSAYRNKSLFKELSKDSFFKDYNIKLVSSSFVPNKNNSLINYSNLIYEFCNLSYQDYLELILESNLILISSERINSMAGLTSFLECYALNKRIFLTPNIYEEEYMKIINSKSIQIFEDTQILNKIKSHFLEDFNSSEFLEEINNKLGVENCTKDLIRKLSKFHY